MRTMVGLGLAIVVTGAMSAGLAVGCGNGDDETDLLGAGSDAGAATGKDGGATGNPGDSGTDDGGTVTSTTGSLLFGAGGVDNNGVASGYQVVGVFAQGSVSGSGGDSPCGAMVNGCQFCGGTYDAGTVQVSFTPESAGTLAIDDGATSLTTLPYLSSEGLYQSDSDTSAQAAVIWNAGDVLTVTAPGAAFPSFHGAVTAPVGFTGVSPAFTDLAPATVSTGGFTVGWTKVSDSAKVTLLLGVAASANSTSVSCTADDSAGQIVVPASLLAQLEAAAGAGDPGGTLTLSKQVSSSVTAAGGATVAIDAQAVAYSGTFTFSD